MTEPFRPDFRAQSDLPEDFNNLPEDECERLMAERERLLHIYAQFSWHGEARIVGNRNALTVLRDAVDAALSDGKAETTAMVTDGEGYAVQIELVDRGWQHPEWENMPLPYAWPVAAGRPDPGDSIRALQQALRKANAQLVKRGAKPIADPTAEGDDL